MKNAITGLALLAAACGGGTAETTTTTAVAVTTSATPATTVAPTTTAATTTTTAATTTTSAAAGPAISIAVTDLGEIVVDDHGMTLYLFLPDDQGASTCSGGCATTWPPLTGEFAAGSGIDPTLLGTTVRGDGTVQVTYNGWPLYRYVGDGEAGDTAGQGLGGNWWVVDAAGEPVM